MLKPDITPNRRSDPSTALAENQRMLKAKVTSRRPTRHARQNDKEEAASWDTYLIVLKGVPNNERENF